MKKMRILCVCFLLACLCVANVFSQENNFNLNAPIPVDSKVITGKLDNGLTYYIRKNELPKDRAEFRLVVDAGAVLEDDDQNGLAHFCEHMAFNGTKNFPKKAILDYLRRIGVKFGHNINAFTSYDETQYELYSVPITEKAHIDTCLSILYDWACNVSFENEEVDKERGVIKEEWRQGNTAARRLQNKMKNVLLKNSKYAKRDVIGDTNIIANFSYDVIKRFYTDWYRPDLQAVVVVGDFDVTVMEEKIKALFSKIPAREKPRTKESFQVPDNEQTVASVISDKEGTRTTVYVLYKQDIWLEKTIGDYKKSLAHRLYSMMINNRLNELTQKENPPFMRAGADYTQFLGPKYYYLSLAMSKNEQIETSLKTLFEENKRIKDHGFTATELEREKKSLLKAIETAYKEKDKTKSEDYISEYTNNFTMFHEPIPGIEWEYEACKKFIPEITLEEINQFAKNWITDKNCVITITAPEKENVKLPSEEDLLRIDKEVKASTLQPYVDKVADKPLFTKELIGSKVDKKENIKEFEAERWILKNGIKIVLKPTDFKKDEILFTAYSLGGYSLYESKDDVSSKFADAVIDESGISDFDKTQLQKLLADKIVGITPYISEIEEGLDGRSSPDDFETLLQLINLYFTQPRKDQEAFNSYLTKMEASIENKSSNPASIFQDSIQVIMSQYHPRNKPWTKELIREANFNRIHYIYNERFGDPTNFTFYFVGNIDLEKITPLIEKYLGGLPTVTRNETWKDLNINPPKSKVEKTFNMKMEVPKSTVFVSFYGDFEYNMKNRIYLDAIKDILEVRYTESIREDESGTYGVGVYSSAEHYPKQRYKVIIYFNCAPENVEKLTKLVFDEIEKLKKDGPVEKDLNNLKENKLKERAENLKENDFWLNTLKNYDFHKEKVSEFLQYENIIKELSAAKIKETANLLFKDNYVKLISMPVE